jgi:hypothetical protein
MMYTLDYLMRPEDKCCREVAPGKWVIARPKDGPFWWRVKAAWAVLRGHADAFTWPGGQRDFI